jgi:hypothetical protein
MLCSRRGPERCGHHAQGGFDALPRRWNWAADRACPPLRGHTGPRAPLKAFARVFALAPDCHTTGRYMRVWQRHFYGGLRSALPSVVVPTDVTFDWARPANRASGASTDRQATSERVWQQVRAAHAQGGIDAVISYCFSSDVDGELIDRTVALGIPWVNFFCDSVYAFDLVEALASRVSLNWFPERAAEARYRALGRAALCRPYAVHAAALSDAHCERADHAVGFVGAPTGNRILRLAGLWARGSPGRGVAAPARDGAIPAQPHRCPPGPSCPRRACRAPAHSCPDAGHSARGAPSHGRCDGRVPVRVSRRPRSQRGSRS